jgi:hypothetical protein
MEELPAPEWWLLPGRGACWALAKLVAATVLSSAVVPAMLHSPKVSATR